MDELSQMIAIEKIKRLKALYFRALDSKDWLTLESIFAEDATLDYRGAATDPNGINSIPGATENVLHGARSAVSAIRENIKDIVTVHHGHMPEIDILSDDRARAVWAMFDILRFPPGGSISDMIGYGHYEETYVRIGDEWKIASLSLSRIRVDTITASSPIASAE